MGSVDDFLGVVQQAQQPSSDQGQPAAPQGSAADQFIDLANRALNGTPPPPAIPTHEDVTNIGAASNTRTGLAKGAGRLLEMMTPLAMVEQNIPQDMYKPGDVGQQSTNAFLGGQAPYQPQTGLGRVYQNTLSDTVASAPMAALGTGGLGALALRQGMNLTGNLGGEIGREALPNHPIIGGILGSLAGSSLPAGIGGILSTGSNAVGRAFGTQGAAQREAVSQLAENPAYNMPMSQVDDILSKQGGSYWTPGRINSFSELNKRQAVNNILPPSAPAGTGGRGLSDYMRDIITYGVGEGLGAGVGHLISHATGLPSTLTDIAGSQLGGIAAGVAKYKLPNLFGSGNFNQRVSGLLSDPATWQAYQQQQQAPGLISRLLSGYAAPVVSGIAGP